jgi:hypothetical protein
MIGLVSQVSGLAPRQTGATVTANRAWPVSRISQVSGFAPYLSTRTFFTSNRGGKKRRIGSVRVGCKTTDLTDLTDRRGQK